MKTSEIQVGLRVWCNVSGRRTEVEIVADTGKRGRRYSVKRVDNGKPLGLRSAAALHPSKGGAWSGAFGGDDTRRIQAADAVLEGRVQGSTFGIPAGGSNNISRAVLPETEGQAAKDRVIVLDKSLAVVCPLCHAQAVIPLTVAQLAAQPDDTTLVCHPALGGCNHGFCKD